VDWDIVGKAILGLLFRLLLGFQVDHFRHSGVQYSITTLWDIMTDQAVYTPKDKESWYILPLSNAAHQSVSRSMGILIY
jgi:hypothetical protein